MNEKVTRLPVRNKSEPKTLQIVERWGGCRHKHAIVDRKLNELECADCHEKLNPIEFLVRLAGDLNGWDWQAKELAKARSEFEARKRCRCTKCGQMTDIRRVGKHEAQQLGKSEKQA